MLDPRVHFQGFWQSPEEQKLLEALVEKIESMGPSDAFIEGFFSKSSIYHGSIRIKSAAGDFSATDFSKTLENLLTNLYQSLKRQLDGWKNHRFLPHYTPHLYRNSPERPPKDWAGL